MSGEYIYAVSRIRSREGSLLTRQDIDRLISEKTETAALRYLKDKGWGTDSPDDADAVLSAERAGLWSLMYELVEDRTVFDIFKIPDDYHNLKVAVKAVTRSEDPAPMFVNGSSMPPEEIYDAVLKGEYDRLPERMQETARAAMTCLLQTSDGQLCDIVIDAAALDALRQAGENSKEPMIRDYCEITVAAANIKVALRAAKTGKNREFMENAIVYCSTLDKASLISASLKGVDEICSYLQNTEYKDAASALKNSPSAFEKWCDDFITEKMQSQKYEYFTVGPLIAYVWAKENEFKAVRLILAAKRSGIDENIVRERMRNLYV